MGQTKKAKIAENHIDLCRSILRARLSPLGFRQSADLQVYESQRAHLEDIIRRAVTIGESNSALIIGPRGSGKTALLDAVLKDLQNSPEWQNQALSIQLNGFVHTDDKLALKEITSQLRLDEIVKTKAFANFSENLSFLLTSMKDPVQGAKTLIFVLDEFDLFCHHKNQTLLYNLFDVAQAAQSPICVVGLTCRLDVIELLEKRVKSRFSHRQLYLLDKPSWDEYVERFCVLLSLGKGDHNLPVRFCKDWDAHVRQLSTQPQIQELLKRQYARDTSFRPLRQILLIPVSQLSHGRPKLEPSAIALADEQLHANPNELAIKSLSALQIYLILAMKYLDDVYEHQPANFEMVFAEYLKFAHRFSSMRVFERPVALKAFEQLESMELIKASDGAGNASKTPKEYVLFHLLVNSQELKSSLHSMTGLPSDINQWIGTCTLSF